jgi:hypothetical protein
VQGLRVLGRDSTWPEGSGQRLPDFPLCRAANSLKVRLGKFYICSCRNILMYQYVRTDIYYVVDIRGDIGLGMG